MHPAAEALNVILSKEAPALLAMLSRRGREIYFPHGGILGQTAAAKGKRFNATIGIALEENGSPMRLPCMDTGVMMPPRDVYPYAPSFGKAELRQKWLLLMREKNPSYAGPLTLPIVTAGLTHGLTVAGSLFLDDGDEVILPDLFWGNYRLIFEHQFGAALKTVPTFDGEDFNVEGLRDSLKGAPKKRVVLLNFPNNPTGYTPTVEECRQIVTVLHEAAAAGNRIVVLLDDAYFGLGFERNIPKESLLTNLGNLHENLLCVKIDGATKEDYAWGHRIGFLTFANPAISKAVATALEDKIGGTIRASVSNACHMAQSLLLRGYDSPDYMQEKREKEQILKTRYEAVQLAVNTIHYRKYFTPLPFNSGYFMCIRLSEGLAAEDIRKTLLEEFDTGVIATGNLLRIAFSSIPTKDIPQLFANIASACGRLAQKNAHVRTAVAV